MKPFKSLQNLGRSEPGVTLETERLHLRPARLADWPQWAEVRRANYLQLKPLEPAWPPDALTESFFSRRVTALQEDWRLERGCSFLLWLKTGALVGGFNLNHVSRGAAQQATLGYWLDAGRQGQGLMTEAARAVADFAFGPFRLHRLHAATLPGNARSQALLMRLGFTEEGFARRYIQIDGAWRDHTLFGLTAEDWVELFAKPSG